MNKILAAILQARLPWIWGIEVVGFALLIGYRNHVGQIFRRHRSVPTRAVPTGCVGPGSSKIGPVLVIQSDALEATVLDRSRFGDGPLTVLTADEMEAPERGLKAALDLLQPSAE